MHFKRGGHKDRHVFLLTCLVFAALLGHILQRHPFYYVKYTLAFGIFQRTGFMNQAFLLVSTDKRLMYTGKPLS